MRQQIVKGKVSYEPNSIGGGCPFQAMMKEGGFTSHEERIDGSKIRARSQSFVDHYSQAKLFYNSQAEYEKTHLQNALIFELSKVTIPAIRERVVGQLAFINKELAEIVAKKVGVKVIKLKNTNGSIPPDSDSSTLQSPEIEPKTKNSRALSMAETVKDKLQAFADETHVDEIMVAGMIYDHDVRVKSYKILSELHLQKNEVYIRS